MQSSFDCPKVYQILHSFINDSSKLCTPERLPLDILKQLYHLHHQIENLKSEFESVRLFKDDGNTFYRCAGISFLEYLCRSTTDPSKFDEFLNNYKSNSGYMACREISWQTRNTFIGLLEHMIRYKSYPTSDVLRALDHSLQVLQTDVALVNEMRSLTANYIQANSSNKLFDSYSRDLNAELSNILTPNKECSELAYNCLSSALGVYIKIVSLQPYKINIYGMISHRAPILVILKSDKYDILYSRAMNTLDCYDSNMMDYTRYILAPEEVRAWDEKLYWVNRIYLDCKHSHSKQDILNCIRENLCSRRSDASSAVKCFECPRSTPIDNLYTIKADIQEIMNSIPRNEMASIPAILPNIHANLRSSVPTSHNYHYLQAPNIPQSQSELHAISHPQVQNIAQPQIHAISHPQVPNISQPQILNISRPQPQIIPQPQLHNTHKLPALIDLTQTYHPSASSTSKPYTYTTDALHFQHLDSLLNCRISASGSVRIELEALKRSFASEEIKSRLDFMMHKYDSFRRSRGDGNCYYRAVGIAYLEHLCRITTPFSEFITFYDKLRSDSGHYRVREINSSSKVYFMNKLQELVFLKLETPFILPHLEEFISDTNFDLAVIHEMRCIAANYLEMNHDKPPLSDFLFEGIQEDMKRILSLGTEAEGITFSVMACALEVFIQHVSVFDNSEDDPFEPPGMEKGPMIYVMFKKGHYDMIYSRDMTEVDGYSLKELKYGEIKVDASKSLERLYYDKRCKEMYKISYYAKAYGNMKRASQDMARESSYNIQSIESIAKSLPVSRPGSISMLNNPAHDSIRSDSLSSSNIARLSSNQLQDSERYTSKGPSFNTSSNSSSINISSSSQKSVETDISDSQVPGLGNSITFSCGDGIVISKALFIVIKNFLASCRTQYITFIRCDSCKLYIRVSRNKEVLPFLDTISKLLNRKFEWNLQEDKLKTMSQTQLLEDIEVSETDNVPQADVMQTEPETETTKEIESEEASSSTNLGFPSSDYTNTQVQDSQVTIDFRNVPGGFCNPAPGERKKNEIVMQQNTFAKSERPIIPHLRENLPDQDSGSNISQSPSETSEDKYPAKRKSTDHDNSHVKKIKHSHPISDTSSGFLELLEPPRKELQNVYIKLENQESAMDIDATTSEEAIKSEISGDPSSLRPVAILKFEDHETSTRDTHHQVTEEEKQIKKEQAVGDLEVGLKRLSVDRGSEQCISEAHSEFYISEGEEEKPSKAPISSIENASGYMMKKNAEASRKERDGESGENTLTINHFPQPKTIQVSKKTKNSYDLATLTNCLSDLKSPPVTKEAKYNSDLAPPRNSTYELGKKSLADTHYINQDKKLKFQEERKQEKRPKKVASIDESKAPVKKSKKARENEPIILLDYRRYPMNHLEFGFHKIDFLKKLSSFYTFMKFEPGDDIYYVIGLSYLEYLSGPSTSTYLIKEYLRLCNSNGNQEYCHLLGFLSQCKEKNRSSLPELYSYFFGKDCKEIIKSVMRDHASKYLEDNHSKPYIRKYIEYNAESSQNMILNLNQKVTACGLECLARSLEISIRIYNLDKDRIRSYGYRKQIGSEINLGIHNSHTNYYTLYTQEVHEADNYDSILPYELQEAIKSYMVPETQLDCGHMIGESKLDYIKMFVSCIPEEFEIKRIKCFECPNWSTLKNLSELNEYISNLKVPCESNKAEDRIKCLECMKVLKRSEFSQDLKRFCNKCAYSIIRKGYVKAKSNTRAEDHYNDIITKLENEYLACEDCKEPIMISETVNQDGEILYICFDCNYKRKCVICHKIVTNDQIPKKAHCKCMICATCCDKIINELYSICTNCNCSYLEVCSCCGNQGAINLDCGHHYCRECIVELSKSRKGIYCPECHKPLTGALDEYFTRAIEEKNEYLSTNMCQMCLDHKRSSTLLLSDCGKKYCKKCFTNYMIYKLEHEFGNARGIECPFCLDYLQLKSIKEKLNIDLYNRYREFIHSFKKNIICPICKSSFTGQYKVTQCVNCPVQISTNCLLAPHDELCNPEDLIKVEKKHTRICSLTYGCPSCGVSNIYILKASKPFICSNLECSEKLCQDCLSYMSQVVAHGAAFHSPRCRKYNPKDIRKDFMPFKCSVCKRNGKACRKPT